MLPLYIHLTTLALTALVILYTDHRGLKYFLGKEPTLPASFITWSHRLVWLGLLLMIGSGAFLVSEAWSYFSTDPAWLIKMGFVAVLVINACAIGRLSHVATTTPFAELSITQKRLLLVSGIASSTGWIGSALIGFFWL